jgi:hypothetical protein
MKNKYIDLFKEMIPALDMGMKDLWDAAGEDGQKEIKGDLWNLNRYMSVLEDGKYRPYKKYTRQQTELAVFKTNEYYNKNWAILGNKHPKLQWLLLCQCGNTGEPENHAWIGFKTKTDKSKNKARAIVEKVYPNMKLDEVELLAGLLTKEELKQLAENHGIETKDS